MWNDIWPAPAVWLMASVRMKNAGSFFICGAPYLGELSALEHVRWR